VPVGGRERSARLPFELADFEPGSADGALPPAREALEALAGAVAAEGARLALSIGDLDGLTLTTGVARAALHLRAAALVDLPLIAAAAGAGGALWLDTAMATLDEVGDAVAAAVKAGGRVTLVHGL